MNDDLTLVIHDFRWVHPDGRVKLGLTPPVRLAEAVTDGWRQETCDVFRSPWVPIEPVMRGPVKLDFAHDLAVASSSDTPGETQP